MQIASSQCLELGMHKCSSKTVVDLQRRNAAANERGRLRPLIHKTQHFGQGAREVERRRSPEERPARGRASAACCACLLSLAPGVRFDGPRTGKSHLHKQASQNCRAYG
jgi:hypothetical protein